MWMGIVDDIDHSYRADVRCRGWRTTKDVPVEPIIRGVIQARSLVGGSKVRVVVDVLQNVVAERESIGAHHVDALGVLWSRAFIAGDIGMLHEDVGHEANR